jgi:hypothetical protein
MIRKPADPPMTIKMPTKDDFPQLSPVSPAPKPVLNFKKTVQQAAVRLEPPPPPPQQPVLRKRVSFHDLEEEDEEGDAEFNADLISSRRRGDKGVW